MSTITTTSTSTSTSTTIPTTPDEEAGSALATAVRSDTDVSHRVTLRRVTSSEWLKFRSVRSNLVALLGSAAAAIGLGALFASLAGSDDGPQRLGNDALSLSLGGFEMSQLVVAILGVALVAGEYQTGLVRTWFAAAPSRLRVLAAKIGVYGASAFVVTLVAATLAFLAGQAVFSGEALTLVDDGVLQALVGTAFYAACIGVMGIGLGFLLRSTAAGAGAVVTTLMIAPILVNLLPDSIADPVGKILPSNAGSALRGVSTNSELLSAGWGLAVLLAWVAAIVGAAAISLRRRDA
ncbi:MAG: hypothetical protein QNJ12_05000 [Ilumatobacter sp.]|uniref:hypothetical protein n=1 Tax=Ilumatobacter sp. TaxID=1967498 RepID=UPI00260667B7|nr:hypothetical protein [Ilumatobacter sp.]MDJ0768126.1 hypothetical protein [Ilumatobacter sp.]